MRTMYDLVIFVFMVLLWIELANISSLNWLVRNVLPHAFRDMAPQIVASNERPPIGLKAYMTRVQLAKLDDAGA